MVWVGKALWEWQEEAAGLVGQGRLLHRGLVVSNFPILQETPVHVPPPSSECTLGIFKLSSNLNRQQKCVQLGRELVESRVRHL